MIECEARGRGWGQRAILTINGDRTAGDLWVLSDGTVVPRRARSAHTVTESEALTASRGAVTLIIGTGCLQQVAVGDGVALALSQRGIGLTVLDTPRACAAFNEAESPCAAILHCAC